MPYEKTRDHIHRLEHDASNEPSHACVCLANAARVKYPAALLRCKLPCPVACYGVFDFLMDFLGENGLWQEAKDHLEEHEEDEILFGFWPVQ